ncbi:flagellar biosynthesis repressor FlbT [Methylobacterium sp. SI9]|uniref:flagellar biosynthesis repressor FlbT n=1 Tax=Methylobacterium guangdongense TaxID=3138811 RepID=UPI00313B3168
MPLRIDLKPFERLIINGAAIRNGDRRSSFIIETQCRFLRESESIFEEEADTPCKRLCFTLQVIHLTEDTAAARILFCTQASDIMDTLPGSAKHLIAINKLLASGDTYKAIKATRILIAHEADVLQQRAPASDVA